MAQNVSEKFLQNFKIVQLSTVWLTNWLTDVFKTSVTIGMAREGLHFQSSHPEHKNKAHKIEPLGLN